MVMYTPVVLFKMTGKGGETSVTPGGVSRERFLERSLGWGDVTHPVGSETTGF